MSCFNHIEELKTLASEVSDLVQSKVGTTAFAATYSSVRQHVESVRRERCVARNVQMTTNPEAAMKRRISKNKGKKDSRKRKNNEFAYVLLFLSFFSIFIDFIF